MVEVQKGMNKWQYAYYVLLLLIMFFLGKVYVDEPPMVLRLAFLAALFVVPIKSNLALLPAILSCFFIISDKGVGYNILPSDYFLYCVPLLLCVLGARKKRTGSFAVPGIVIAICVYSLIINIIASGLIQNLTYSCLIVVLYVLLSSTDYKVNYKTAAVFLAFASVTLSLTYFTVGAEFTRAYGSSGLERTGWVDPNYFSTTIGFPVLVSIAMLMSQKNNVLEIVLFLSNILLSTIVMVLVASRGGILSLAAGTCVLLYFSKIKFKYKILIFILIAAFVIYLFINDYFALLQYRIVMDETGGSGRIDIWRMKLRELGNSSPIFWLFGMGYQNGIWLGGTPSNYYCFHNDFVSYLVCYGIIGFVLFIHLLIYPIRTSNKKHYIFPVVLSLIAYLAATSLTLEPMSSGSLGYYCYYFFVLLLVRYSNTENYE